MFELRPSVWPVITGLSASVWPVNGESPKVFVVIVVPGVRPMTCAGLFVVMR